MTTMNTGAMEQALIEAAKAFAARTDSFAAGKADTCIDLAGRLRKFGAFASAKQADFAVKLVEWAKPREAAAVAAAAPASIPMHALAKAVEGFAKVSIGELVFSRDKDGARWITRNDELIGRFEHGVAKLFNGRMAKAGIKAATVIGELVTIEQDPAAAIIAHGKLTGICGCCGRTLTDPASIEAGIGPVCAKKFGI